MSDTASKNDKAGDSARVEFEIRGRQATDTDSKLITNMAFYMQEVVKLFPADAQVSLVAHWKTDDNSCETVNFGTLNNLQLIQLLTFAEIQNMQRTKEEQGDA